MPVYLDTAAGPVALIDADGGLRALADASDGVARPRVVLEAAS